MRTSAFRIGLLLVLAASTASAQIPTPVPSIPFGRTGDLYVSDSSNDSIYRLKDLNLDGDWNDAGEVELFYASGAGAVLLGNNAGIAVGPDGIIYVCDSTTDIVAAFEDLNGDGDAQDTLEAWVYFDGNPAMNAAGIQMASPQSLTVDAAGVVWVAQANAGSAMLGTDSVLRLEDTTGDQTANQAGEAVLYATIPSASLGDSIPTDVAIGPGDPLIPNSHFVYYSENGTAGNPQRGIYRLHDDVTPNGNCNDPGEISPYMIPPAQAGNAFHWGMAIDAAGNFYLGDTGNDIIWRGFDANGDLTIDSTEMAIWWQAPGSSLAWHFAIAGDGTVFVGEDQTPDRVLWMHDDQVINGNVNDPNEVTEVYNETLASIMLGNMRAVAFDRAPTFTTNLAPPIGTTQNLVVQDRRGIPISVWLSTGSASLLAPPYGTLGISVFPPDIFGEFYTGVTDAVGKHTVPYLIPNAPVLIGATFHLQALAGPLARLRLSNPVTVVWQP